MWRATTDYLYLFKRESCTDVEGWELYYEVPTLGEGEDFTDLKRKNTAWQTAWNALDPDMRSQCAKYGQRRRRNGGPSNFYKDLGRGQDALDIPFTHAQVPHTSPAAPPALPRGILTRSPCVADRLREHRQDHN